MPSSPLEPLPLIIGVPLPVGAPMLAIPIPEGWRLEKWRTMNGSLDPMALESNLPSTKLSITKRAWHVENSKSYAEWVTICGLCLCSLEFGSEHWKEGESESSLDRYSLALLFQSINQNIFSHHEHAHFFAFLNALVAEKSFQYFLRALETYNTYDFTKFTSLSQSCKMRLFYVVKGKVFSVDFSWPFYVLKFLAQYWIMGGNFLLC